MLSNIEFRKYIPSQLKNVSSNHIFLWLILVSSFIVKVIYVFYFTDYKNYLVTDMGVYWGRAEQRYNGDIFSLWQWSAWATFFDFYLCFLFKIINILGLMERKLEVILCLNIIYSTISVYCLYRIATHMFKDLLFPLLVTFFYAFFYPLIYFNAFVLAENLSIPALIASTYLLFTFPKDKLILFLSGVFLGLGAGFKPSLVLIAVPYFIYIVFAKERSLSSLIKGFIFTIGFLLVIFLVVVENNYISKGELKGLAGNGGVSFFIWNCRISFLKSFYQGFHIHIGPPTLVGHPELDQFTTERPIHGQKYFYQLGLECLKKKPGLLLEHFKYFPVVFFGPLLPSMLSAWNFVPLMTISNYVLLFMFLSFGMFYFMIRDDTLTKNKEVLLMAGILLFIFIPMYIFGPEQRYIYPGVFAIYLLFFTIISRLKDYKRQTINYCKTIVLVYVLYLLLHYYLTN